MVAVPGAWEAPVILGTGIGMTMPKMECKISLRSGDQDAWRRWVVNRNDVITAHGLDALMDNQLMPSISVALCSQFQGKKPLHLTQTKEHLQTAVSNVSKCKSAWTIARRERKARTTSKIRQAQRNLRALKDQLRRLEGEYAAATSLTPSAGAHLGSVRDRYAYDRYISLLYASTFIIGVVALAGVRRRMSSDAVHVAIARGAVPTYGAVDV